MKKLLVYFIQGIIVVIPGAITLLILYRVVLWLLSLFTSLDTIVHPYADPLLIVLIGVLLITVIGAFASNVLAQLFMSQFEKILERIPIVKHIYSPVKDVTSAFIGNKRKFSRPVLITTNAASNIREFGFITDDDLHEFGINKEYVAVYVPHSYAISGRLLVVPMKQIEILDVDAADTMKYIVSGGITDIDEDEPKTNKP